MFTVDKIQQEAFQAYMLKIQVQGQFIEHVRQLPMREKEQISLHHQYKDLPDRVLKEMQEDTRELLRKMGEWTAHGRDLTMMVLHTVPFRPTLEEHREMSKGIMPARVRPFLYMTDEQKQKSQEMLLVMEPSEQDDINVERMKPRTEAEILRPIQYYHHGAIVRTRSKLIIGNLYRMKIPKKFREEWASSPIDVLIEFYYLWYPIYLDMVSGQYIQIGTEYQEPRSSTLHQWVTQLTQAIHNRRQQADQKGLLIVSVKIAKELRDTFGKITWHRLVSRLIRSFAQLNPQESLERRSTRAVNLLLLIVARPRAYVLDQVSVVVRREYLLKKIQEEKDEERKKQYWSLFYHLEREGILHRSMVNWDAGMSFHTQSEETKYLLSYGKDFVELMCCLSLFPPVIYSVLPAIIGFFLRFTEKKMPVSTITSLKMRLENIVPWDSFRFLPWRWKNRVQLEGMAVSRPMRFFTSDCRGLYEISIIRRYYQPFFVMIQSDEKTEAHEVHIRVTVHTPSSRMSIGMELEVPCSKIQGKKSRLFVPEGLFPVPVPNLVVFCFPPDPEPYKGVHWVVLYNEYQTLAVRPFFYTDLKDANLKLEVKPFFNSDIATSRDGESTIMGEKLVSVEEDSKGVLFPGPEQYLSDSYKRALPEGFVHQIDQGGWRTPEYEREAKKYLVKES